MITYKEFAVLNAMLKATEKVENIPEYVYKKVHYYAFKSQDEVASLVASLEEKEYLKNNMVTELGKKEIEPLKVKNAVILAAWGVGISTKSV